MKHNYLVHPSGYHDNDDYYHCMFCEGGLSACTTCGGLEGSLTKDCAGSELSSFTLDKVWKGDIDFRDGNWTRENTSTVFRKMNRDEQDMFSDWIWNDPSTTSMAREKMLRGW